MKNNIVLPVFVAFALLLPTPIFGFGGGSKVTGLSIGFKVEGLNGSVTLSNGSDTKKVTQNGSYTFDRRQDEGSSYNVKVSVAPTFQVCTISNGSGTVGTVNVSHIKVSCVGSSGGGALSPHTISGTVSGATGSLVVKKLSWVSPDFSTTTKTLPGNGSFSLSSQMNEGGTYIVTVDAPPEGQQCAVTNGSGSVSGSSASGVAILCKNLVMGIQFTDVNWKADYIKGTIKISRAADESNIQNYVLRYGGCSEFGYNQICKLEIFAELPKTGFDLEYELSNTYLFTQARRFLLLQTRNNSGQLSSSYQYVGKKVGDCPIFKQSCGIDVIEDPSKIFVNWMKTEQVRPAEMLYPNGIQELISILRRAYRENKRVRMTGSGLSPSDVAITEDILLRPTELAGVLKLDRVRLKNASDPLLVRVLSGTRIREINAHLDSQNQAIGILGGFDGQTIVGVTMTATHGSSLNYGPITSFIESMQVVGENGKVFQIEPSNGMTNPASFPGKLEEDANVPVQLIQDDNTFNAMTVSLGSMGIVYSVTLRVEKKYWIHEERTLTTWNAFKAKNGFLDRLIRGVPLSDNGNDPVYYEFQVSPYLKQDGSRTVLLTQRWKSLTPLKEDNPKLRGQFGNDIGTQLIRGLQQPLVEIMNAFPEMMVGTIEDTLRLQSDDSFNNLSYKVFHIGDANYIDVSAIELGFKIEQTVAVLERMFEVAQTLRNKKIMHSVPFAARFVKPSDSMIAMMQGQRTLMVEIIMLNGANGQQEFFQTYQETFVKEFHARPHWGLDMKFMQGQNWPRTLYPKWDQWVGLYRIYNKNGTFDAKFTDRLGISIHPR